MYNLLARKSVKKIKIGDADPFEFLLAQARYILLYNEINSDTAREVNTKLICMAIKAPKKSILLEINSPGGNVADGIAIMNTILTIPAPVITYINGEADSMAGFISVVGDHRVIAPTSYWMGHSLTDGVCGTPQTIKDRALYLEKIEASLFKIFSQKTKLTDEEFKKMLRGELWLSGEECLEKGIVDEIKQVCAPSDAKPKSNKRKK